MLQATSCTSLLLLAVGLALGAMAGCSDDHDARPLQLGPSALLLQPSASLGEPTRPPVAFDHGKHTQALSQEGCTACHDRAAGGALQLHAVALHDGMDRHEVMDAYHHECLGCHQQRAKDDKTTGPMTCGGCHIANVTPVLARDPMRFDYGLHQRHSATEGLECKDCHHVFDQASGKLVYAEGKESACSDCHRDQTDGKRLSLRHASHTACITCHDQRKTQGKPTGPVTCDGCHDGARVATMARPAKLERIDREQPDRLWLHVKDAKTAAVPFDHQAHELLATNCSTCHHAAPLDHPDTSLRPCKDCHSLAGMPAARGVTLEQAHHDSDASQSCVGCHQAATRRPQCAGCHDGLNQAPSQATCGVCHSGPSSDQVPQEPPAPRERVSLAALPADENVLPTDVMIGGPEGSYAEAKLPHRKIVEHLDRVVRENGLASTFHARVETLCAGCHHHSPVGTRPPRCGSCHGSETGRTEDHPDLRAAYHRQCIGCHEQMKIEPVGCVGCHAEATKEEKR